MEHRENITPIGITNYRNTNRRFGIFDNDRLQHIYCIGKTGVGKSTLLKNMALSDIEHGNGICVLDPHGDLATELFQKIPTHRNSDIVYINPKLEGNVIGFNPLNGVHPNYHHLVAASIIGTFKKIWWDSWGARMEHILRFTLITLLNVPDATLLDIQPLLTSQSYREQVLSYISDISILAFWHDEFGQYSKPFRAEVIAPVLNKIGVFNTSPVLKTIFGQKKRGLKMLEVMDNQKVLICNLSKGELGEDASSLLGCFILTTIQFAALFRSSREDTARIPFYIYVDEMHSFITLSFANILAEGRKYGLSLFLTHQFTQQVDEQILAAIFGNVGTIISFRVGATDADYLAKEFYPVFNQDDLINLPRYAIYLKLMINGMSSQPFSAVTIDPRGYLQ